MADVASLKTMVEHLQKSKGDLQKSKDVSEQSCQSLKLTLEEGRYQHASAINDMESNIIASIREQFSSQRIK